MGLTVVLHILQQWEPLVNTSLTIYCHDAMRCDAMHTIIMYIVMELIFQSVNLA